MTREKFSKQRRSILKAGAAAAAMPAGGLLPGPAARAEPAPVCIRSPWVRYSLDAGSLHPDQSSLDSGNEDFPALVPVTADGGQWTDNPDGWTGDGAGRALAMNDAAEPSAFRSVLLPGRSAYLLGLQLEKTVTTGVTEMLVQAGHLVRGGGRGLQVKINSIGKPLVTLWDDDGGNFSLAGRDVVSATNGGRCTLFIYLDHRPQGSRTLGIYQFESGTVLHSNRVGSTSHLGHIGGGEASAANRLWVGARQRTSGSLDQFFLGTLRGLTVLNFGNTPPANVGGIMEGLSVTDMAAGPFMEGA